MALPHRDGPPATRRKSPLEEIVALALRMTSVRRKLSLLLV
jgi:hypothetical protein